MRLPRLPGTRSRWFALASRLLVAMGATLALLAWLSPPDAPDCEDPDSACSVFGAGERRMRDRELERIGGKNLVLMIEFKQWLGTWFRGRRLQAVLAVSALLAALGCSKVAGLLEVEEREAARPARQETDPGERGPPGAA